MRLRSRYRFQQGEKRLGRDLIPMSRQDDKQAKNLSSNMKRGAVTKNQWLATEMRSRHAFEVETHNAVESKIARSRHAFEVTTQNLLRGQKNVVATKINIAGNKNDVTI